MAKKIDNIKEKLLNEILSINELENVMAEYEYIPVEIDDDSETIKFTNYNSQIWIDGERDNQGNILIDNVRVVSRLENEPTRVEPFRNYEDLEKVLGWFKENGYFNHWITGWLMTSLGRRVGDTIALKWSDIFKKDGKYRERLTQLKEEKTGKKLAPRLNALARLRIGEYIKFIEVDPIQHYDERIVDTSSAAFRKMLKKAIDNVGLEYSLSTHSFRKYYANTIYKLHPQDADNLMIVQSILGHSDVETTKIYINEIDRKIDQYNEDYANYMILKNDGVGIDISNSPIISLKSDDFRELLNRCWNLCREGSDKFDSINQIIGDAEKCMI